MATKKKTAAKTAVRTPLYPGVAERLTKGYYIKRSWNETKYSLVVYSPEKAETGQWPYNYVGRFKNRDEAELLGQVYAEINFGIKPKSKSPEYTAAYNRVAN